MLWKGAEVTDLGVVESARDIHDLGQVVGSRRIGPFLRAFVGQGTTLSDLDTLIDPALGWELEGANAINDAGQNRRMAA
jgi:hypothetical protein